MKIPQNSFIITLIILTLTSCHDPYTRESISPIIGSDLPASCSVGDNITFKVYHVVYNGCGKYSRSETTRDGRTITVKFYGKYRDAICPQNIPTLEREYSFKAESKGDYFFKFFQNNFSGQDFLLDTLKVQ